MSEEIGLRVGNAIANSHGQSDVLGDGRLLKELLVAGSGPVPQPGDIASIHYNCRHATDEDVLDSSRQRGEPFDFTLGDSEVILGLEHAVASMQAGEQAVFTVHPDLALGIAGCAGGMIPPSKKAEGTAEMDCDAGGGAGKGADAAICVGTLRIEIELVHVSRQAPIVPECLSQEERLQRAMKAKETGNTKFKSGDLQAAVMGYDLALQLLDFSTTKTEGDPGAVATEIAAESENQWTDIARREARDKLGLTCLLNLAQCEIRLERFVEAQEHAGMALALEPENSKAIYRRGLAALGAGFPERAKADLLEACRREPRSAEVRAQWQECQRRLQASERHERSTFGGMFERGGTKQGRQKQTSEAALYDEKSELSAPNGGEEGPKLESDGNQT